MSRVLVFSILLAGCGGPAFEADAPADAGSADATPDDAAAPIDAAREASKPIAADANAAREGSAEPLEAAPWADVCAPVIVPTPPPDGGSVFARCVVNASPSSVIPAFYAIMTSQGCSLERTPLACQCASSYSCACLKANTTLCTGACDESGGAPIVSCQ